ncbi:MAG TPA: PKD domain-containing protein, partial [Thermoanaerobaculia bacterium]|nr:PKD domain-containing protein [Thermoanaerobaculia bacterium]
SANFQGFCDPGIPTDCVFDPTRTPSGQTATACPGSSVKKYFWDFGDGNSTFVTPPPSQIGHTYPSATNTDVCLTVFCNNNSSATTCHCFVNNIGINGCILPTGSWTP